MTKKKMRAGRKIGAALSYTLLGVFVFFTMFALLSAAITPERYDIQVGSPAPNTIKATKDVEDTITTNKLRSNAAGSVKSIYIVDESVRKTVEEEAGARFKVLAQVASLSRVSEGDTTVTENQLLSANEQFAPVEVTLEELTVIGRSEEDDLNALISRAMGMLSEKMAANLMENQTEAAVKDISDTLILEGGDEKVVAVIGKFLKDVIRPNYFFDEEATNAARRAEMDKIQPQVKIKGEVIVSDGEIVTEAQYKMLDSLGIVKESALDITLYYGVALLVLLLTTAVVVYIWLFDPEIIQSVKSLFLLSLISVIVVGTSLLVRDISPYLMPTTLGILLVSQLVKRRLAIVMNVVLSVAVSLFASASTGFFNMAMFTIVINSIVGGMVGLLVLKRRQQRTITLIAGLAIGLSNMICTFAIGLINNANLINVLVMAEWSAGSGILAAFLCIALMPIMEAVFNIVTPSKLIELSNPNQPLLRRLLLEAPGTYHHSIIVANLAEAAAGEIGANALLARVGAYYHDVGKLKRPSYFKENQMGDNPHDRTDPRVSTAILTAHPRDGAAMLMKERLPEQIIEIVRSHHGDTPVMYFYNKSRMENGGDVDVNDFRYDGPRPISREAAIVMMADTVEAAARSMPNPDSEKLNQLIRNLVRQKTDDGQLDNCQLTFADIDKICTSFYTVLSGVFHERIEYPSIEIPHFRARVLTESAQADAARKEEEKKEEAAPSEKAPAEEKDEAEAAVENAPAEGKQAPSEKAVKEETPPEEAVKEETPEKENAPKEETDGAENTDTQADTDQTEEK
ncbi:MAG: HDIG domain-containing protein [Clostridia bacterium]|nr:HDIG domain-containing protein [Clostridia bacterium]